MCLGCGDVGDALRQGFFSVFASGHPVEPQPKHDWLHRPVPVTGHMCLGRGDVGDALRKGLFSVFAIGHLVEPQPKHDWLHRPVPVTDAEDMVMRVMHGGKGSLLILVRSTIGCAR